MASRRRIDSGYCAVILGAGRGGTASALPSALTAVSGRRRVLDWQLDALARLSDVRIVFVGGYGLDEILKAYPAIEVVRNRSWSSTGAAGSLACADLGARTAAIVTYADVVFRAALVARLAKADADVCLAVDTKWRERYESRAPADVRIAEKVLFKGDAVADVSKTLGADTANAEFSGVVKLSPAAAAAAARALREGAVDRREDLPAVLRHLLRQGFSSAYVDVVGDWAELNAPQDLARFVLGTKAETLERLREKRPQARIGELIRFTHGEWERSRGAIVAAILGKFRAGDVIVRSSALDEDTWHASGAGAHLSQVVAVKAASVRAGVERVFASYRRGSPSNQVLVQRLLKHVEMSGVVMTRTAIANGPYYVINFDDVTSSTDTVTSGKGQHLRTIFVRKNCRVQCVPPLLRPLLTAVREVEDLVGYDSLDIEFAARAGGRIHVLQVRPMVREPHAGPLSDEAIYMAVERAERRFRAAEPASATIVGRAARYSVMTDWNPAEIIGVKPRRLGLSLYRRLVTDEVWAQSRAEYGYRDVRPCPLLVEFAGHPYIDVRASFNTFVPGDLPKSLARRLVERYLARLALHPQLHDKVEFDILLASLTVDFHDRARSLLDDALSSGEVELLRRSLARITKRGLCDDRQPRRRLERLESRREQLLGTEDSLRRALALLEDVRRLGTPAFATFARSGFIAVALLDSFVRAGIISEKLQSEFLASVRTPAIQMQEDAFRVKTGRLAWRRFIESYGHLRPGTFDILSPTYRAEAELILRPVVAASRRPARSNRPIWRGGARRRIGPALAAVGLDLEVDAVEDVLRKAIDAREWSKFSFSKNLSLALDALSELGAGLDLSASDLSHVALSELHAVRNVSASRRKERLRAAAEDGRAAFDLMQAICLPSQLVTSHDFACFEQPAVEPNFVTTKTVRAETRLVAGGPGIAFDDVEGRIVILPNADPGYDWLFSRSIAGLVTMYGGVNSHMAIRAAGFGLPAAIGVGENLFERISAARVLEINCAARRISIVEK